MARKTNHSTGGKHNPMAHIKKKKDSFAEEDRAKSSSLSHQRYTYSSLKKTKARFSLCFFLFGIGVAATFITACFISFHVDNDHLSPTDQPQSIMARVLRNKVTVGFKPEKFELSNSRNSSLHHMSVPDGWTRGPLAIFYNIFIDGIEVQDSLDIVKEQIHQLGTSPVVRQPVVLYYNLLGNIQALNVSEMLKWCADPSAHLHCERLGAYPEGSERITLQDLRGFCIKNPGYRVTYIHSKGSYHASFKNTAWRRLLTAAAISPKCVQPPDASCNLCGLQFFTQFTFFVPGNMFTASCEYVGKLLPLDEYVSKQERRVKETLILRLRNQLRSSLLWDQLDFWGLDRYVDEHWIGSHPDVIPCDVDPYSDIANVFNGSLQEEELEWSMGPRSKGIVGGIHDELQISVRTNPSLRRREILLLPGLLIRWWIFYATVPSKDSWVWQFFPDGDFWQSAIDKYGPDNAVQTVTKHYRTSIDGSPLISAFSRNQTAVNKSTLIPDSDFVIFYRIGLSDDCDRFSWSDFSDTIVKQMEIVADSVSKDLEAPLPVVFNIGGPLCSQDDERQRDTISLVSQQCQLTPHLNCINGGQFRQNYEGETLSLVHKFCTTNPTARVSYIHNEAPLVYRMAGGNENLILALTMAALNHQCQDAIPASCDVCGLIFQTIWIFSFLGNMFTSSCEYISRLLPPREYERRMNDFVGELFLRRLRRQSVTTLLPEQSEYFLLDRYSAEAWIGSHPSLRPCELSTASLSSWDDLKQVETNFSVSLPQMRYPKELDRKKLARALANETIRLREFHLMPGLLLKWTFLYNELPNVDSWVWWTLPDGTLWMKAMHDHGLHAVDKLASPYAIDTF